MTPKAKYRELCKVEKTIPIFSKDWWMDAVCGEKNWDVLLVEKGGEVVASMPIYIKEKFGLKYVTQGKLTQTNGIWIKYPEGQKYSSRLSYEKEVMNKIIDQLEGLDITYYQQNFHYSVTNWLPFYWRGFQQTTRYTSVIEDLSDLEKVFEDFSKGNRKIIRKAENEAEVFITDDINLFYSLNKKVFERQNMEMPYTFEFIKKIDDACKINNSRVMIAAKDSEDNVHSIIYLIWDEMSAYLIMSGTDPEFRSSNFKTLLTWEGIKYASNVTKKFDFEGSMIEGIADYFRGYGPVQKPYFAISKAFKHKTLFNVYKSMR
jgi:hypothetical protein